MAMFRSLVASAQQRQPPGGPAGGDSGLEAQYSCPICLEVYHRPVAIGSCGHTFCGECLQPCLQVPSPLCPLCRLPFDPKKVDKAAHVEKQLSSYKAPCRGCNKKVTLAKMRVHVSSCMKVQEQMANCPKFVPVVPTSQPIPSAVPNRSTFTCPYCGARNLDQQELLKHCVDNHRSDPNRVVSRRPGGRGGGGGEGGGAGSPEQRSAASARTPCCRCAPSARRCPGGTPATRAPTSCSTCCTDTSSPTTPLWITASTRKLPSRLPWPCLCPRTEGTAQPLDLSPPASGHGAAAEGDRPSACVEMRLWDERSLLCCRTDVPEPARGPTVGGWPPVRLAEPCWFLGALG
ncbi:E3 ubiquitin-protein ligase RNF166 isoform X1 [Neomonachus schauinslandi]|uniref:E3 ubiquitin-protein ligase RNF166 n=1 Tax=Neomonachus schauinslandi TaxID=29088 RepID=A0A8M1MY20_NEOSC|nr:E3 ubiquitin-protein ligase RNF166 isoform X1 [Neomonachus schauinslandi]